MYRKYLKRAAIGIGLLMAAGVAGILLFLGWLWLEHGFALTLPEPTGPFAVGRTVEHWIDPARKDVLGPEPGRTRELMIWIWYPAAPKPGAGSAEYLPASWSTALKRLQGVVMSRFFTRDPAKVRTHSIPDAEVAASDRRFPVLLLKSGIGALAIDYTSMAEEVASHGYVVVGSDSPHSTTLVVFPDGRQVTRTAAGRPGGVPESGDPDHPTNRLAAIWSADTRFELDRLERLDAGDPPGRFRGRLDLRAVGVFGHSFGGATAAQSCRDDPRFRAGVDLDGSPAGDVIDRGLDRPFLFLLTDHGDRDHGDLSDPIGQRILANIESIRARDRAACPLWTLDGSRHFNFSDHCLTKDRLLSRVVGAVGPIEARRGLAIASDCVRTFFDVHLKGAPADRLDGLRSRYPELSARP